MKTKITMSEFVDALSQLIEVTEEKKEGFPDTLSDLFFRELLFLNVFTIDLSIHTSLSHNVQREAVRDAFYSSYHAKLLEITKDPGCFGEVANRLVGYSEAFKSKTRVTYVENIANAFAGFYGTESAYTIMRVATHFFSLCKQVQEFIDSFDISEDRK